MLVTSASEIAVGGNAGITVAPARAPGSAAGVRTCARNAASLKAVTGLHTCILAGPVTQTEPPLTYVKRFGTVVSPAVPKALWHPVQTRANEAGSAGPVPPTATHAGGFVVSVPTDPEMAEAPPPSSPPPTMLPAPPVEPVSAGLAPDPAWPPAPPTPLPPTLPEVVAPSVPEAPTFWPPLVPALPQPAPRRAAARRAGARTARREVWTEVSAKRTLLAIEGCPIGHLVTRERCGPPPFSWHIFRLRITSYIQYYVLDVRPKGPHGAPLWERPLRSNLGDSCRLRRDRQNSAVGSHAISGDCASRHSRDVLPSSEKR